MADRAHDDDRDTTETDARGRREFLKQAGRAAAAAPALALILKAEQARAYGRDLYGNPRAASRSLGGQALGNGHGRGHGHGHSH